jgi:hypothetical protein
MPTLSLDRISHPYRLFRPELTSMTFEEESYRLVARVGTTSETDTQTKNETHKIRWATRKDLLPTFHKTCNTTMELNSYPLSTSLGSFAFHSLYPEDAVFSSSGSNTIFS